MGRAGGERFEAEALDDALELDVEVGWRTPAHGGERSHRQ
jgi:hypothetical protein